MSRSLFLCIIVVSLVFSPSIDAKPIKSTKPASPIREALQDADHGNWAAAEGLAGQIGDPVLKKLIEWMDLSRPGTNASFARISTFIETNRDWPSMGSLKKRAEDAIPQTLPPNEITTWFDTHAPITPDGMTLYADSLDHTGRQAEAQKAIREFWISGTFSADQERDYLARFSRMLSAADVNARFDRLMWEGLYQDARQTLPLLDRDDQAAGHARLVLATNASGAEAALAEVPGDRRNDPGLIFARVKYDEENLRDEDAIALLSKTSAESAYPSAWWAERTILARRAIDRHEFDTAYKLAEDHHQIEPSQIAEAEWFAGWIALRFLHNAEIAAKHFDYMFDHVETPISKSRAAYWAGRAELERGDPVQANNWFGRGAQYTTTFYGQLSAEIVRKPLTLPPEPKARPAESAQFSRNELVRAAKFLHEANDTSRVNVFLSKLAESAKTPAEEAMTVWLARDLGATPLSVQLAKKASQNNICTLVSGYPVLNTIKIRQPEPALVHGIIRQESLFNPAAFSPVGAIGLMQLMPATAQIEAKKLGIRNTNAMLSQDPAHNVLLGSQYLDDMIDNYGGSYVLAIASYNAGPGHVRSWLQDYGDPRRDVDPIDWIELIPLHETRNYVQRVLENLEVYRARLTGNPVQIRLLEDLRR